RAALEQDAPAAAHRGFLVGLGADGVLAEHADLPFVGDLQADDRAHQHRLAGAGTADDAEDFAAPHLERQVLVDHLRAEAVAQPFDLDRIAAIEIAHHVVARFVEHDVEDLFLAHAQPTSVKNTAKNASSTMTMKIA